MTSIQPRGLAALVLAAMLLVTAAAVPSATAQTTPQSGSQPGSAEFSDEQLRAFAAASLEVEDLHGKWQPQIAAATEPREQAEIRDRAMQEMAEAVRDSGLSIEDYNGIVRAVQADPATARTVHEYRSDVQ